MSSDDVMRIVSEPKIDFDELEELLGAMDHTGRVETTRRWGRKIQSRLFDQAEGRVVTLDQLVPTNEPLKPVRHAGKNTVFPVAIDHFEKRFARAPDSDDLLYGYNESWYRFAVSPGYYVAYEDAETGEVVVDYTRLPEDKPDEWPKILPNWFGLGSLVFLGMKDRLRRVSDHVTIGRAFKSKPMNQWFVLTRQD